MITFYIRNENGSLEKHELPSENIVINAAYCQSEGLKQSFEAFKKNIDRLICVSIFEAIERSTKSYSKML